MSGDDRGRAHLNDVGQPDPEIRTTRPDTRRTLTPSSSRTARERVPELPPLQLPEDGLRFPGLPPTPTRQLPRSGARTSPTQDTPRRTDVLGTRSEPNWEVPIYEDERRRDERSQQENVNRHSLPPRGVLGKITVFLGLAGDNSVARRAAVGLVGSLIWSLSQFVIIIAFSIYSGVHKSHTQPDVSEWIACDRPLGLWNALWLVRVILSTALAFLAWRRERVAPIQSNERRRNINNEHTHTTQRAFRGLGDGASPNARESPSGTWGLTYEGTSGGNRQPERRHRTSAEQSISRLINLWTLAWFLSASVLAYTSVHTCRESSPHLWWLTFGILCITYLTIAEIFLLGLLVFILAPVLYLLYNISLLCLGRHPIQNPHYIKPDVDKLPKAVVEQIPLVLYIPPPPGETTDGATPTVTVPPAAHSYPPKTPTPSSSVPPKRRFAFFRRKKGKKGSPSPSQGSSDVKSGSGMEKDVEALAGMDEEDEDVPWDEMWEKGEYPFVRLEGNRAVCAICLMDFEEPKRIRGMKSAQAQPKVGDADAQENAESGPSSSPTTDATNEGEASGQAQRSDEGPAPASGTAEIQVEHVTEEERDALKLNDAGEGAQPLRLLACGHVFHQTCIDPWLIDVSGRCPICQRPVEVPEPSKKNKRRRRT